MIGAHLSLPVGGEAADLETLLVKVDAGLGVVHALVVLGEAICVFLSVSIIHFFRHEDIHPWEGNDGGRGGKGKGRPKNMGKRKKEGEWSEMP